MVNHPRRLRYPSRHSFRRRNPSPTHHEVDASRSTRMTHRHTTASIRPGQKRAPPNPSLERPPAGIRRASHVVKHQRRILEQAGHCPSQHGRSSARPTNCQRQLIRGPVQLIGRPMQRSRRSTQLTHCLPPRVPTKRQNKQNQIRPKLVFEPLDPFHRHLRQFHTQLASRGKLSPSNR